MHKKVYSQCARSNIELYKFSSNDAICSFSSPTHSFFYKFMVLTTSGEPWSAQRSERRWQWAWQPKHDRLLIYSDKTLLFSWESGQMSQNCKLQVIQVTFGIRCIWLHFKPLIWVGGFQKITALWIPNVCCPSKLTRFKF